MSVSRYDKQGDAFLEEDYTTPPGARYAQSFAKRMDEALQRGGDLQAIARELGTTPSELRKLIRDREATGRWRFVATDGHLTQRPDGRYGRYVVTAGQLQEVKP